MTHSLPNANVTAPHADSPEEFRAIAAWLDRPAQPNLADELEELTARTIGLRACDIEDALRTETLGRIYCRAIVDVEKLLPTFAELSFPTHGKPRPTKRSLQELLHEIARDLISLSMIVSAPTLTECRKTALWQAMHALSCHVLISNLAAAPPKAGVWQLLHTIYQLASKQGIARLRPAEASSTYQDLYFATILSACGLPASFSPRETRFLADYLLLHSSLVTLVDKPDDVPISTFWIDTASDMSATPCSRKAAPLVGQVIYFDCGSLATLIRKQLAALRSGLRPEGIGLDGFARTPAGRGCLRRLAELLGTPGKRRFPRRRQHYRVVLCAGLENLWRLFGQEARAEIETSSWMITNESPDGYLIMHVLGKASDVSVGDIVAVKAEDGDKWQVCITRWARSENQEHLEFGLKILAIDAIPAMLASTTEREERPRSSNPQPVLILPKVAPLRVDELLVTPSGFLDERPEHLVLVIEQENLEIREVRNTQLNEQTAHIEVFLIEPDVSQTLPASAAQVEHPQ